MDQKRASYLALNEEYINSTGSAKSRRPNGGGRFAAVLFSIIFTVLLLSCLITFIMAV